MGLIQQLKNSGTLKFYADYRAGHSYDLAGGYGSGTLTGCKFEKKGLVLTAQNDKINYGTTSIGQTSALTVITKCKAGNITLDHPGKVITKQVAPDALTTREFQLDYGAAADPRYWRFICYKSGAGYTADSDAVLVQGQTYFLCGVYDGANVLLYVDGVVQGTAPALTGNLQIVANSELTVGKFPVAGSTSQYQGNIEYILIITQALTTTQQAQIRAELESIQWDSKPYSKAITSLTPKSESGLVLGFDTQIVDAGILAESVSRNNATLVGKVTNIQTPIGMGFLSDGTTGSAVTSSNAGISGNASRTMEVWAMSSSVSSDKMLCSWGSENAGQMCAISINASKAKFVGWGGASYDITGSTTLLNNLLYHLVITHDSTTNVHNLYVNGVLDGTATQALNTDAAVFNICREAAAVRVHQGYVVRPQLWNYAMTATQVAQRYNEVRNNVKSPIFDFGIKQETSVPAANADIGGSGITQVSAYSTGVTTINGAVVKYLTVPATGASEAYFDLAKAGLNTTEAAYGSWEYWCKFTNSATSVTGFLFFVSNTTSRSTTQGYAIKRTTDGVLTLSRVNAGVETSLLISAASLLADNIWYKIKVSRTFAGIFTVWVNDSLVTAATGANPTSADITYTAGSNILFRTTSGTSLDFALSSSDGKYNFRKGYFA